jgi:hypothetical protein
MLMVWQVLALVSALCSLFLRKLLLLIIPACSKALEYMTTRSLDWCGYRPCNSYSLPSNRIHALHSRRRGSPRKHVADMAFCARLRERRIACQSLYELSGVSSNGNDIGSVRRGGWRRVCRCRCEGWCAVRRLRWRGASPSQFVFSFSLKLSARVSQLTNQRLVPECEEDLILHYHCPFNVY